MKRKLLNNFLYLAGGLAVLAALFYYVFFLGAGSAVASGILECVANFSLSERGRCYDEIFRSYLSNRSAEDMLKDFEGALMSNASLRRDCHQIAHAMGRATYSKIGSISEVFRLDREIESCAGGFFHGAIEELFRPESESSPEHITHAEMKEKIPELCDLFTVGERKSECFHGIGHGAFYVLSDLKKALDDCKLIRINEGKFSCFSGVFMENNVYSVDKTASNAPDYPCLGFEGKEREACFFVLSFRLVDLGFEPEEIIKECGKIEGLAGELCKRGFGIFFLAHEALAIGYKPVIAFCSSLDTEDARICMESVAARLTSTYENGSRSMPFCDGIPSEYFRVSCFSYIADVLRTKFSMSDRSITEECRQYAKKDQECIDFIDQVPEPVGA